MVPNGYVYHALEIIIEVIVIDDSKLNEKNTNFMTNIVLLYDILFIKSQKKSGR